MFAIILDLIGGIDYATIQYHINKPAHLNSNQCAAYNVFQNASYKSSHFRNHNKRSKLCEFTSTFIEVVL